MRIVWTSVSVLALLLVAGCGSEDDVADMPEQVFPENGDDERRLVPPGDVGSIEGTLGGDAQLEGGCGWVETGSGRYEVVWPEGYRVEFEPVRLLRGDEVVAEAGDPLTVRGRVDADAMSTCQVGPIFKATSVDVG